MFLIFQWNSRNPYFTLAKQSSIILTLANSSFSTRQISIRISSEWKRVSKGPYKNTLLNGAVNWRVGNHFRQKRQQKCNCTRQNRQHFLSYGVLYINRWAHGFSVGSAFVSAFSISSNSKRKNSMFFQTNKLLCSKQQLWQVELIKLLIMLLLIFFQTRVPALNMNLAWKKTSGFLGNFGPNLAKYFKQKSNFPTLEKYESLEMYRFRLQKYCESPDTTFTVTYGQSMVDCVHGGYLPSRVRVKRRRRENRNTEWRLDWFMGA